MTAPQTPQSQPITEKDNLHVQWYEDAKTQTRETLPAFIDRVMNGYKHDYGTVTHAVAACMTATLHACDHMPQGGITGFQASFVMWQVMEHAFHIKPPHRLQDMRNLLYPQFENRFTTITEGDAEFIQAVAKKELAAIGDGLSAAETDAVRRLAGVTTARKVVEHWRKIAKGWIPFGLRVAEEGE